LFKTIFRSRSIWTSIRLIGRCYWTDRGDPTRGNTMNRAPMDPEADNCKEPEILFTHLMEGIGLALVLNGGRMFITDFGGGSTAPISMGRTGGRCCLRKETSPALHTRRCRPNIEPLDTFYVKGGGPLGIWSGPRAWKDSRQRVATSES
jgi:hypothetical protein